MCTTSQPFLAGLQTPPEDKQQDLQKIRSWMLTQPHLPTISDEYIYLFLHACYYNQEKTKHAIESYFTIKTNTPSLFSNRDVYSSGLQVHMDLANVLRLPNPTPEGYKVLLYSLKDTDYSKLVFADAIKAFCMFNDAVLSEDGLAEGYVVLFDMKGITLGHLARVSLPALRAFMLYIQDAHPARLKAIHVLNTANYINHIMRMICPLIRSELLSLIKFHKGMVPEGIAEELMPEDYGGQAPSVATLNADTRTLMYKYNKWLLDSETFTVDETKRAKKTSWWGLFNGTNTSPTTEKPKASIIDNFDNLQID